MTQSQLPIQSLRFSRPFIVALGMLVFFITGCVEPEESAVLKEAKAVNEQNKEKIAQFEQQLAAKRQQLSDNHQGADSREMQALDSLDQEFKRWKEGFDKHVLPAPCNHDHADGEHHHHPEPTPGDDPLIWSSEGVEPDIEGTEVLEQIEIEE